MPVDRDDHDEERRVRVEQQRDALGRRFKQLTDRSDLLTAEQRAVSELALLRRKKRESEVEISTRLRSISRELRTNSIEPVQKLQGLKPPLQH